MNSFSQFCEEAKGKLDRQLDKKEITFLYWMYRRYEKEQKNIYYIS